MKRTTQKILQLALLGVALSSLAACSALRSAAGMGKVVLRVVVVLAVALFAVGCATGPLGSHGVDHIPAFQGTVGGGGTG